ncbi:MAG: triose-phosphate isomerase [Bacteroidales bacterium]|jgi:triosephosphate isomerase|nr:triose-phosphate isomerase [Bacteroidales bacterium]
MKDKLVIGNWKMNKNFEEAEELLEDIAEALEDWVLRSTVVLCPPFPYLEMATDYADESGHFACGAQNCAEFEDGAYTGEVSAKMLHDVGVQFCIVGHSERRKYFGESSENLSKKVNLLLENDIIPVFCCGELQNEREHGKQFDVVSAQIKEALFHLTAEQFEHVVIAYEPVWAIGTGLTASPKQAEEMHAFIRTLAEKQYGTEIAYNLHILYGGSCNAQNALELFMQPNVDGGLIGGASLKANDFLAIIEAAETVGKEE